MSVADTAPPVQALGFTFTETMGGFLSAGAMGYRSGYARGQRAGEDLRFTVTVTADDLSRFVREPQHSAVLTGSVEGYWVGGTAAIEPGPFNLFARDRRGRRQMRYHFLFPGREGVRYVLDGFKDVHNDYVFDGWKDTTTLFTTLRREDAPGGPPTALGILKIRPLDLVPQVWSMRGVNARGLVDHLRALARFNLFFAGEMVREYTPRPFAARERDAAPGE